MRRRLSIVAVSMALASVSYAGDGILGTKSDAVPTASGSPVGVMAIVQMAVALGFVLGLVKYALPKLLTKVAKPSNEGEIVVEATTALGAGTVHIVRTRGKTLLVGATATGMTTLADLTEDAPITFDEAFARTAVVEVPAPTEKPSDELAMALARLQALEK